MFVLMGTETKLLRQDAAAMAVRLPALTQLQMQRLCSGPRHKTKRRCSITNSTRKGRTGDQNPYSCDEPGFFLNEIVESGDKSVEVQTDFRATGTERSSSVPSFKVGVQIQVSIKVCVIPAYNGYRQRKSHPGQSGDPAAPPGGHRHTHHAPDCRYRQTASY